MSKDTTTIRVSSDFKRKLDALGLKTDTYEMILKRLVCLHELVKHDTKLLDEAQKRAEAER